MSLAQLTAMLLAVRAAHIILDEGPDAAVHPEGGHLTRVAALIELIISKLKSDRDRDHLDQLCFDFN